jgi:hypothetical protein
VELLKNAISVAESANRIPPEELPIPENDSATESQLQPAHKTKALLFWENDLDKTALIGIGLNKA